MEITKEVMELLDSKIKQLTPDGKHHLELVAWSKLHLITKSKIDKNFDYALLSKWETLKNVKTTEVSVDKVYKMVSDFCDGVNDEIEEIIESYMALASSTAFSIKASVPKDELLAQAYYALTLSTNVYATLENKVAEGFTSYTRNAIFRSLRDFCNSYHMVRIPTSTMRDNLKNRLERYKPLSRVDSEILESMAVQDIREYNLDEMIDVIELSAEEVAIVKLVADGYTQVEASDKLNIPLKKLENMLASVRKRANAVRDLC